MRQGRSRRAFLAATLVVFSLATLGMPTVADPQSGASTTSTTVTTMEDAPLIVLFDVSGSMNDSDANGVNKLSAAKTTMSTMLREQSGTGTKLGLWTYPGQFADDEGCYPGSWIPGLSPTQSPDPTNVDATIRTLTASGETPTGPALAALVEGLKEEGYTAATIVLVSDGESNCGVPPCEVAQQLGAEGFKLHVPTVGFDISELGRTELECIANSTGSTYHEAGDAEQLISELEKYHPKDLELEVSAPKKILPGANAQIIATIHNPSPTPVVGAKAVLALGKGVSRTIFPTVLAPQRPLTAIPAGGSMTVKWIATSSSTARGTASWKVVVGSPEAGSALATGEISIAQNDLTTNDAGPLLKNLKGPVVVLGDSYSSGEGTGRYISDNKCHRSTLAYGALLGGQTTDIIACSGATTADVTYRKQNGTELPQIKALESLSTPPGLVFMTIGGNDIGFADIVTQCLISDCASDVGTQRRKLADIAQYSPSFENTLRQVVEAANTPEWVKARNGVAPVVISPYPDILWLSGRGTCAQSFDKPLLRSGAQFSSYRGTGDLFRLVNNTYGFSPEEMAYGRNVTMTLNQQLRGAVGRLAAQGYPIVYADSVLDFAQPSHTICDADSYFVQLHLSKVVEQALKQQLQELAHPNARGHRAWANEVISWTQTDRASQVSTTMPTNPKAPLAGGLAEAIENLFSRTQAVEGQLLPPTGDGAAAPEAIHQRIDVHNADTVTLDLSGARPGSVVTIVVHSTPTALGTIPVDDNGVAHGDVKIPHDLHTGQHTLVASALSENFEPVLYEVPLSVGASPAAASLVAAVALFFLATGATLALLGRHQLRTARSQSTGQDSNGEAARKHL